MKTAIIGSSNFDSLEYNIQEQLIFDGNECEIFDYKRILHKKYENVFHQVFTKYFEYLNKYLLSSIIDYNPDLVIAVYRNIHPLLVKGIKAEKIKIIHINPDALTTFQNQQLFLEPYDAYFTKDPYILNFLKNKLNFNVFLFQEAFNPRIHSVSNFNYQEMEREIGIDVLCFGTMYPYRNRMLKLLKKSDISFTLYGTKSKYFDEYLDDNFKDKFILGKEKAKILNGSKIVFNNFHYAEVESVNNKFFEINGSGAFQICDYKPILKTLLPFDPIKISFKNLQEAEELIKYYLNNPEERWEIRKIIHKHFSDNFTYEKMLNKILDRI